MTGGITRFYLPASSDRMGVGEKMDDGDECRL